MKRLTSLLAILIILTACGKEGLPQKMPDGSPFYTLLERYESHAQLSKTLVLGKDVIVQFKNAGEVSIASGDFKVSNCLYSPPESVTVDPATSRWLINGVPSNIPFSPEYPGRECSIVYSYFTSDMFAMVLSNGELIGFYCNDELPLKTFSIKKKINKAISSDIIFNIDGNTVSGEMKDTPDGYDFIPEFSFRGDRITVNGKEQKSGISVQNFAKPVTYTVVRYDGTAADYTVSLVHEGRFPTIRIDVDNHAAIASKEEYVTGTITFEDYDHVYSDTDKLVLRMKIRGRGNSTWNEPKKPYKVKLDEKSEVFGIHKDNDWDLLAEYLDKSLLRNQTAMEISRICGMKWTPEMVSADLYIDGAYRGIYTLSEHKEVSGHKVDIGTVAESDNSGDAITGGYYLEIDGAFDGPKYFTTGVGIPILFSEPEEPTDQQFNYVKNYFKEFENVLYSGSFTDKTNGYRKYIDVESFINYFIVAELALNPDGNLRKSSYLTKERGGKLEFYHVWDFDLAFGNCNYIYSAFSGASNGPEGWFIRDFIETGRSDGWYGRLFKDPAFVKELKARWNAVYPELQKIPDFVDSKREMLGKRPEANFKIWRVLGVKLWPNIVYYEDYDQEVEYLKTFYNNRLVWMNSAISSL